MTSPAFSAEALVDAVRRDSPRREELVPLLHEAHPAYDGLGESAATRLRGWVMASFATVGLPASAIPSVIEVLRTGTEAFAVAAAGRAAQGAVAPPTELVEALVAAIDRFRARDDSVSFDALRPTWPAVTTTTALTEVLAALQQMGPAAHGVHAELVAARHAHGATWSPAVRRRLDAAIAAVSRLPLPLHEVAPPQLFVESASPGSTDVRGVVLQDQAGQRTTFDDHFRGRHQVVAFFYTRCGNPRKCAATVTRLVDLQGRLEAAGLADLVGIAAISYDPGYDLPERLAAYGSARGLRFTPTVRMFRAPSGHADLRAYFDLKVGYAGSIVNQHAVELYLLSPDTSTARTWSRIEWTVDEVFDEVSSLHGREQMH